MVPIFQPFLFVPKPNWRTFSSRGYPASWLWKGYSSAMKPLTTKAIAHGFFSCLFLKVATEARLAFSSSRIRISSFNSTWEERTTWDKSYWSAVTFTAGGLLIGAGSVSSCEYAKKRTNVVDPKTYPTEPEDDEDDDSNQKSELLSSIQATSSAPRDPMTIYAKLAIKREMEEQDEHSEMPAPATPQTVSASTQATSPVAVPTKKTVKTGPPELSDEEIRIEEATRKAKQHSGGMKLFSGNGNMALSLEIARHLGINLGKATVGRFADGECNVVIHENVRGKDVYVIQPTCPPVNDNMMELLLMVSTLRRASARRITVVIPYYGYARQDRKMAVSPMTPSVCNCFRT